MCKPQSVTNGDIKVVNSCFFDYSVLFPYFRFQCFMVTKNGPTVKKVVAYLTCTEIPNNRLLLSTRKKRATRICVRSQLVNTKQPSDPPIPYAFCSTDSFAIKESLSKIAKFRLAYFYVISPNATKYTTNTG